MGVNLTKSTEEVKKVWFEKVSLTKEKDPGIDVSVLENAKMEVYLVLDVSGSMGDQYRSGVVQDFTSKVVPLSLAFDDDGLITTSCFNTTVKELPDISINNYENYIQNEIISQDRITGGTNYAPPITTIVNTYKKTNGAKKKGFLSGLFGRKKKEKEDAEVVGTKTAKFVIFVTDGDNWDKPETEKIIKEASEYPIFIKFIGINQNADEFQFLEKLDDMEGRNVDNVDFKQFKEFGDITYDMLLDEVPGWLANEKVQDMLK